MPISVHFSESVYFKCVVIIGKLFQNLPQYSPSNQCPVHDATNFKGCMLNRNSTVVKCTFKKKNLIW